MNRMILKWAGLCFALIAIAGCKSAPAADAASTSTAAEIRSNQNANNVDIQPLRSTVIDWSNRNIGESAVPLWLKPTIAGNSSVVRNEFDLASTARVGYSLAQRANRDEARVQAGLLFAAKTANSLKQYLVTGAASVLNEGQMEIVEQITTVTKINITGNRPVTEFWQLVETEDTSNRSKSREYLYYIVYEMDAQTWAQLVRKYVNDVIGQIADRPVQTQVANAFGEIDARAKREDAMSDAEFKQKIDLQYQAAKDAQSREIARINSGAAATSALAGVAEAQVKADARARYAAYKYGDAATAAAASTTAADFDWISALSTAAKVVF
ncbi:hypothetical protein FACS189494_01180 [Spirochaetia bacterium]|nr:hypothetical protein FACS189494_01180 [Spirochaetia bacterium]